MTIETYHLEGIPEMQRRDDGRYVILVDNLRLVVDLAFLESLAHKIDKSTRPEYRLDNMS